MRHEAIRYFNQGVSLFKENVLSPLNLEKQEQKIVNVVFFHVVKDEEQGHKKVFPNQMYDDFHMYSCESKSLKNTRYDIYVHINTKENLLNGRFRFETDFSKAQCVVIQHAYFVDSETSDNFYLS